MRLNNVISLGPIARPKPASVGLMGGAFGHKTPEHTLIYMGKLRDAINKTHLQAEPIPYSGCNLHEYAISALEGIRRHDIIIAYSLGGLVANIAMLLNPTIQRKRWILVSPIPQDGMSIRGFGWGAWTLRRAFLNGWLPPNRIRLSADEVRGLFGPSEAYDANVLADSLHDEPLRASLEWSFPLTFHRYSLPLAASTVFIPSHDKIIRPGEDQWEWFTEVIQPTGHHGWIMTDDAASRITAVATALR